MKLSHILPLLLLFSSLACSPGSTLPPTPVPEGILVREIPAEIDIIFDSVRQVLAETPCLDKIYGVDTNFINLPGCNALIYDPQADSLAAPRQLFGLDLETGDATQITNTPCAFLLGQVVDPATLMTLAACHDTDGSGRINEKDKAELYFLDLPTGGMDCLTCDLELTSINNPDYSPVNQRVVFSAQHQTVFHNYLFTIDAKKTLQQITDQEDFMDFDCSWSEDGTRIVFSRLPAPWFSRPSQVWWMEADGTRQEQITAGGPDPHGEGHHGPYPIGIDADPDLSPDNSRIVFSRLKTGRENLPFGVYELLVVDVDTREIEVLDSKAANMLPQWKVGGILVVRQVGAGDFDGIKAMELKQSLHLYRDERFEELEGYPFSVFPLGAYGGYWIEPR